MHVRVDFASTAFYFENALELSSLGPVNMKAGWCANVSFLLAAVEIRAQETAKGGVKYEAILAEPAVQTPPRRNTSPTRAPKSAKPLEEKLKAAEERRLVS